jgi:hypothetical protein
MFLGFDNRPVKDFDQWKMKDHHPKKPLPCSWIVNRWVEEVDAEFFTNKIVRNNCICDAISLKTA